MEADMTAVRTVAILRGLDPDRTADLAENCWEIGMDLVEVPVQGEAGWAGLRAVAERSQGRAFGAGTVLTAADARRAVDAGVSVVISPSVHADVITTTLKAGAVPLPGVMTPTDVANAVLLGAEICKVFPASLVGPAWFKAMQGPFPRTQFIAVGGINAANMNDFIDAGAVGVGFGGAIEAFLSAPEASEIVAAAHDRFSRHTLPAPLLG
jgi:2-dehydro-3-deoxyphosphogluconate aldolase/(4S)-4-hydroxy-2-oxoglutarate aldolase